LRPYPPHRTAEVRLRHSSGESLRTRPGNRCGAGGAKGGGRAEHAATQAPGAEPGKRATGAGACTAGSKDAKKERFTTLLQSNRSSAPTTYVEESVHDHSRNGHPLIGRPTAHPLGGLLIVLGSRYWCIHLPQESWTADIRVHALPMIEKSTAPVVQPAPWRRDMMGKVERGPAHISRRCFRMFFSPEPARLAGCAVNMRLLAKSNRRYVKYC